MKWIQIDSIIIDVDRIQYLQKQNITDRYLISVKTTCNDYLICSFENYQERDDVFYMALGELDGYND